MNRWHIYEMLKRNTMPSEDDVKEIEKMNANEIKEGFLECLTVLSRDEHYQNKKVRPKPIDNNPFSNPKACESCLAEFENTRTRY